MAALFQQLQHVLAAWDASERIQESCQPTILKTKLIKTKGNINNEKRRESQHQNLFIATVDAAGDNNNNETTPISLLETKEKKETTTTTNSVHHNESSIEDSFNSTSEVNVNDISLSRDRISRLELSRAALALFTSNSGIYRPILRKTLGFIFGFIDELLEENADLLLNNNNSNNNNNNNNNWSSSENEEFAAAHERMRVMEVRMLKLVEEAATQRDHLKAEIAEYQTKVHKLENLLKHQIELTHSLAGGSTTTTTTTTTTIEILGGSKSEGISIKDPLYVKKLIARAETEKAIDDLQQEVKKLKQEHVDSNKRTEGLMELNGKYALQCIELAARLSILMDHNIGIAIENQKYQNEVLIAKRQSEKHLQDLNKARNVVMAAFVNRHTAMQGWLDSDSKKRLKKATTTFYKLAESVGVISHVVNHSILIKEEEGEIDEAAVSDSVKEFSGIDFPNNNNNNNKVIMNDDTIFSHLRLPPVGNNPDTPKHLCSSTSVEYLRVNPFVAERVVHMILSEWRREGLRVALDIFTCEYLQQITNSKSNDVYNYINNNNNNNNNDKQKITLSRDALQIAYALDAVSKSGCCGSLTYAFGLVTRGKVNENLFQMLELDGAILFAICRFLDLERNAMRESRGVIPIVQFASILFAMYPSYSLHRLRQLLNEAINYAGNQTETPLLLHYNILLPERIIINSASVTTENAGALWDTRFAHLLYKFICEDVEESWQTIEDSFYYCAKKISVASEQQLMYLAFKEISNDDYQIWSPALKTAISCWEQLKPQKGSIILEEIPRVPVKSTIQYLRKVLLLRRGTRPMYSKEQQAFLQELQRKWNNFAGGHATLIFERYTRLIDIVDKRRHAVWGNNALFPTVENLRHVKLGEEINIDTLIQLLKDTK